MELDFSSDGLPEVKWQACCEDTVVELGGLRLTVNLSPPHSEEDDGGASTAGTGRALWEGGVYLSKIIYDHGGKLVGGRRAVELGAGAAGLPGVALALAGFTVELTDLGPTLQHLRLNLSGYAAVAAAAGRPQAFSRIAVKELNWCDCQELAARAADASAADLVLCADGCYDARFHEELVDAAASTLAPSTLSAAVFWNDGRSSSVTAAFSKALSKRFAVEDLSLSALGVDSSIVAAARVSGSRVFICRWASAAVAAATKNEIRCRGESGTGDRERSSES